MHNTYRTIRMAGVDGRRSRDFIQGVVNMKCPVCGAAEPVHDTRDIPYTHKGETTTIPLVTGDFCPSCAEVILDMDEAERYGTLLNEFNKRAR
jgi:HTH-type transcriptional regulator / antitoxin MqsA